MTPIEAFSQLQNKRLSPEQAWSLGCENVTHDVVWGFVLQLALYRNNSCHPEWALIFNNAKNNEATGQVNSVDIKIAFKKAVIYLKRDTPKNQFIFLSIWAFQTNTPPDCKIRNILEKLNVESVTKWDLINAIKEPQNELHGLQHYAQLVFSDSILKIDDAISVNSEYWSTL